MLRRWNPGYSDVTCPQCSRRLPLDDLNMLPGRCPVCDEPVVQRETAEEKAERESGYGRAISVGRRTFPSGSSPFAPPAELTGARAEERWLGGRSFEIRPSGLVAPTAATGRRQPWFLPPDRRPFDKGQYFVENIPRSNTDAWNGALQFIVDNHYARGLPNVRPDDTVLHGLFHVRDGLVGVALYISEPAQPLSITGVFPGGKSEALELSRFILIPEVGYNGETWFLSQSRELLRRRGYRGFISFSDPHARITEAGQVVKPGHYGTIYKGAGLVYMGQGRPDSFWFTQDWRLLAYPSGISKIRAGRTGWRSQVRSLVEAGARAPRSLRADEPDVEELNAWLDRWLPRLGRKVRAPGKHKFVFLTDPTKERELRRLGRLAGSELWSAEPVVLPHPGGRDVWPSGKQPSGIARYGEEYPMPPAEPETGRILEPNPYWRP